jgi:hypothetical protein
MDEAELGRGMAGVAPVNQREHSTTIKNTSRDLCKTPLFAQFLCQAQILILKIR